MSTTLVDEEFRRRLRLIMQQFGSVADLARAVGVSDNAFYKWVSGRGQPSMMSLVNLSKAAGVSVEWLATGRGAPTKSRTEIHSADPADAMPPERHSLRIAVNGRSSIQNPQVVDYLSFQPEWLVPAFTTGGATYLFGAASLFDARGRAVGATSVEEFLAAVAPLSLKTMGLLDKPSAPLLGVNGKLDDQAPIADVYLLMEHGSPKSARVYPEGHHMGRTPGIPYEDILAMIVEWLREQLMRVQ